MSPPENHGERIARLEEVSKSLSAAMTEIKNTLKEIPKVMREGFRELREGMEETHSADIDTLRELVDEEKKMRELIEKRLKVIFVMMEHPRVTFFIFILFVLFLVSDTRTPMINVIKGLFL